MVGIISVVSHNAFGHSKPDAVNPDKWSGELSVQMLGAEKNLVQKSGYFPHDVGVDAEDIRLIKSCEI